MDLIHASRIGSGVVNIVINIGINTVTNGGRARKKYASDRPGSVRGIMERNEVNMAKTPIFVRIEPDLKEWLEKQANKERRSLSDYARIVLEDHKKQLVKEAKNE